MPQFIPGLPQGLADAVLQAMGKKETAEAGAGLAPMQAIGGMAQAGLGGYLAGKEKKRQTEMEKAKLESERAFELEKGKRSNISEFLKNYGIPGATLEQIDVLLSGKIPEELKKTTPERKAISGLMEFTGANAEAAAKATKTPVENWTSLVGSFQPISWVNTITREAVSLEKTKVKEEEKRRTQTIKTVDEVQKALAQIEDDSRMMASNASSNLAKTSSKYPSAKQQEELQKQIQETYKKTFEDNYQQLVNTRLKAKMPQEKLTEIIQNRLAIPVQIPSELAITSLGVKTEPSDAVPGIPSNSLPLWIQRVKEAKNKGITDDAIAGELKNYGISDDGIKKLMALSK